MEQIKEELNMDDDNDVQSLIHEEQRASNHDDGKISINKFWTNPLDDNESLEQMILGVQEDEQHMNNNSTSRNAAKSLEPFPLLPAISDWTIEETLDQQQQPPQNQQEQIVPPLNDWVETTEQQPHQSMEQAENATPTTVPLLDYLCALYSCNAQELQIVLSNLMERRRLIDHLRCAGPAIWTTHLKPRSRNFRVTVRDLTFQGASAVMAFRGYLGVSVRQYYYVKHRKRLQFPFLPCAVEYGGKTHRSYYPLELLEIRLENPLQQTSLNNNASE